MCILSIVIFITTSEVRIELKIHRDIFFFSRFSIKSRLSLNASSAGWVGENVRKSFADLLPVTDQMPHWCLTDLLKLPPPPSWPLYFNSFGRKDSITSSPNPTPHQAHPTWNIHLSYGAFNLDPLIRSESLHYMLHCRIWPVRVNDSLQKSAFPQDYKLSMHFGTSNAT